MNTFQVLEPETVAEAVHLLRDSEGIARPIAGGTALMLMLKSGVFRPDTLISLQRIDGLTGIWQDGDELRIGAMTSLSALERSAKVLSVFPVISRTLAMLSTVQVRNLATVGGHLALGDPHRDLPPLLLTLDARVEVAERSGRRWMPVEELFAGHHETHETSLAPDELLTCVAIPAPATNSAAAYHKHTAFTSKDWPAVGVAAYVTQSDGRLSTARIAVGAATEMPVRLTSVEKVLMNQTLTDGLIDEAAALAAQEAEPLADLRGSAAYKREMVRVHTRRALISVRSSLNQGDM